MKKKLTLTLLITCIFILVGCNNAQKSVSQTNMHSMQLLVDQALITATHGANLKLENKHESDTQGQVLLAEASALLRRALSGPEMAMMHKGEHSMPAGMKQTHDLGDAAFDLIALMMVLTPNSINAPQLRQLNERLAIAASGSSMLLQAQSAGDFKPAMQKHARTLLQQASQSFAGIQGEGTYHKLVGHLIEMLGEDTHQAPDKS